MIQWWDDLAAVPWVSQGPTPRPLPDAMPLAAKRQARPLHLRPSYIVAKPQPVLSVGKLSGTPS